MNEITKELKLGCENCQRDCEVPCWKLDHFGTKSAELIESLQAENNMLRKMQPVTLQGDSAPSFALALELSETKYLLAESQRRERIAVKHLTLRNTAERVPCISCAKNCVDSKDYYCKDWVYCIPQEAGKDEQHG